MHKPVLWLESFLSDSDQIMLLDIQSSLGQNLATQTAALIILESLFGLHDFWLLPLIFSHLPSPSPHRQAAMQAK